MLAAGMLIRNRQDAAHVGEKGNLQRLFRALQFESRCAGHTDNPYSVMHHTLFGLTLLPETEARAWALHDLSESVTKDIPRLIKGRETEELAASFDSGLLLRKDLVLQGDDLLRAFFNIKHLDKTIVCEEFAVMGYDGWERMPESHDIPRPNVVAAIKDVMRRAQKGRSQAFGVRTKVPERLSVWLTQKESKGIQWVLEGLEITE